MSSLVRSVRNKFFYEHAENLVRDATSNTNDLPTPQQLHAIGEACAYSDSYPLVFAQLHRRLTHLEYKRHVAKALLVLDYLIRVRPPSKTVQLKLVVDVREHWQDVWRLAKLRVQSSSGTIQQIQRVAERLCEFVWRIEQGEVEAGAADDEHDEEEEERKRRRKQKKQQAAPAAAAAAPAVKKKKRRSVAESSSSSSSTTSSSSSDSDSGGKRRKLRRPSGAVNGMGLGLAAGAGQKDLLSPSRMPNFGALAASASGGAPSTKQVPMSPFGFDFPVSGWNNSATGASTAGHRRGSDPFGSFGSFGGGGAGGEAPWSPFGRHAQPGHGRGDGSSGSTGTAGAGGVQHRNANSPPVSSGFDPVDWTCSYCTYLNPSDQVTCVMCQAPRPAKGGAAVSSGGKGAAAPQDPSLYDQLAPMRAGEQGPPLRPSGGGASSSSGSEWACKFCSFLNPAHASSCHVCDYPRDAEMLSGQALADSEAGKLAQSMNTDGSFGGGASGGSGSEQHRPNLSIPVTVGVEEKKSEGLQPPSRLMSPKNAGVGLGLGGRALPAPLHAGAISCSWCQYLNPPSAVRCVICDKDLGASAHAQRLKLQVAQMHQLREAQQHIKASLSWICVACTHVNPPNSTRCVRCKFDPAQGVVPAAMPVQQQQQFAAGVIGPAAAAPGSSSAASPAASPATAASSASASSASATGGKRASNTAAAFNDGLALAEQNLLGQFGSSLKINAPAPSATAAIGAPGLDRTKSAALPQQQQAAQAAAGGRRPSLERSGSAMPSTDSGSRRSSGGPLSNVAAPGGPSTTGSTSGSTTGGDLPDNDLLALIAEQDPLVALGESGQEEGVPAAMRGHGFDAGAGVSAEERHRIQLEQAQALSAYDEMRQELQSGKWSCAHCSYLNFPQDGACEMCGLVRPSPSNPFAAPQGANAAYAETMQKQQQQQQREEHKQAPPPDKAKQLNEAQQRQRMQQQPAQQQQQMGYSAAQQQQQQQQQLHMQMAAQQQQLLQQQHLYQQQLAQHHQLQQLSVANSMSMSPPLPSQQGQGQHLQLPGQQQQHRQVQSSPPLQQQRAGAAAPVAQPVKPQQASPPTANPFDILQPLSPNSHPANAKAHAAQAQAQALQQQQQQKQARPTSASVGGGSPAATAAPQAGAGEWSCSACTFVNSNSKAICDMCEQPRSMSAQPVQQQQPQQQQFQVIQPPPSAAGNRTPPTSRTPQSRTPTTRTPLTQSRDPSPSHQQQQQQRAGGASPSASADPYSSLLAQGLSHSSSPLPIPALAHQQSGGSTSSSNSRAHSPAVMLAPPKEQPHRHRGASAAAAQAHANSSAPGTRNASISYSGENAGASSLHLRPSSKQQQQFPHGTLPANFKAGGGALPPAAEVSGRESSFNSFDPAFPAADAFSHLHAGTGPKSPPSLLAFPDETLKAVAEVQRSEHDRKLSFNDMFNSNSDLLARKLVGAIPGPDGSLPPKGASGGDFPADLDLDLRAAHKGQGGLAAVGEDDALPAAAAGDEGDDAPATGKKHHRSKEEKEAHRLEKEKRRERKEARRKARAEEEAAVKQAQALAEEERMKIEQAAAQRLAHEAVDANAAASIPVPPIPTVPAPVPLRKVPPPIPPRTPKPPSPLNTVTSPQSPQIQILSPQPVVAGAAAGSVGASPRPSGSPSTGGASPSHFTPEELRQKVIDEIKSTEQQYVDSLFCVLANFMEPLKKLSGKLGVTPKQIGLIFSNLPMLAQFHALFLADLQDQSKALVEVFLQMADFLKMYTQYLNGYDKSIATINSLRANGKFQRLLEEKRDLLHGRGLMFFLIMPVQRIPRYVLLLRELKKHTPEGHPDREQLTLALSKIEAVAAHVNEAKRHVENMSKLLDIQNRIKDAQFLLFKPDRRLLREGMLRRLREEYVLDHSGTRAAELSTESVEQLVFLFNDLLLWTTLSFDITGFVDLAKVVVLPAQLAHLPLSISLAVKGRPWSPDMTFVARDRAEYEEWMRFLDAAIHTATEYASAAAGGGGVRILQRDETLRRGHMRGLSAASAGGMGSPSPQPGAGMASPPPAQLVPSASSSSLAVRAPHQLDGPSTAQNYAAQHPTPKRALPQPPAQQGAGASLSPDPDSAPQPRASHELEF